MAAVRRPRSETQAETRRHLLDAAARLFEAHGFHRTSVGQIAEAAGYTTGAIYANFDRKEDLAVAVLGRAIEQNEAALVAALATGHDLASRLIAVIGWRRAFAAKGDPLGVLRLELWVLAHRDDRLRAALSQWQAQLHQAFVALLEQQAAELGATYRVDPELLAAAILATGDGSALGQGIDRSEVHEQAFAWTLASLMVGSMEPRPIDEAAWPGFLDALLQAAAGVAH